MSIHRLSVNVTAPERLVRITVRMVGAVATDGAAARRQAYFNFSVPRALPPVLGHGV